MSHNTLQGTESSHYNPHSQCRAGNETHLFMLKVELLCHVTFPRYLTQPAGVQISKQQGSLSTTNQEAILVYIDLLDLVPIHCMERHMALICSLIGNESLLLFHTRLCAMPFASKAHSLCDIGS